MPTIGQDNCSYKLEAVGHIDIRPLEIIRKVTSIMKN